ncbi:MAG: hypothetical protein JJE51_04070 [Thermoanaerobaculia bacterium]|nr:hypothetical protein [Thermoanaerobaculia bacterium]
MSRSALALALLALVVAPAAVAGEDSLVTVRPAPVRAEAKAAPLQSTLDSLLENYVEGTTTASGMIVSTPPSHNVIIAHVNSEGEIETSCVVTRGAAKSILAKIRTASQHVPQEK